MGHTHTEVTLEGQCLAVWGHSWTQLTKKEPERKLLATPPPRCAERGGSRRRWEPWVPSVEAGSGTSRDRGADRTRGGSQRQRALPSSSPPGRHAGPQGCHLCPEVSRGSEDKVIGGRPSVDRLCNCQELGGALLGDSPLCGLGGPRPHLRQTSLRGRRARDRTTAEARVSQGIESPTEAHACVLPSKPVRARVWPLPRQASPPRRLSWGAPGTAPPRRNGVPAGEEAPRGRGCPDHRWRAPCSHRVLSLGRTSPRLYPVNSVP